MRDHGLGGAEIRRLGAGNCWDAARDGDERKQGARRRDERINAARAFTLEPIRRLRAKHGHNWSVDGSAHQDENTSTLTRMSPSPPQPAQVHTGP